MSERDVDILVIGAGACGLAAAIAGADAGASVAIIEKLDRPGGNSSLSTGSVPAAGSRFQKAAGIEDSPEAMVRDLMGIAGETEAPELVRRMAEVSAETVEWLVDTVKARIELVTAYKHIGHSVERLHAPISRKGQDLVDDLLAAAAARDVPLAVGNAAVALIEKDGKVIGAEVDSGQGTETIIAGKVILALNGFAGNRALVARFCPEIAGAQYFGARGSTGEAVTWGERLGAGLANMAAYQGFAAVSETHGGLVSWTTVEKGGVMVDDDARRFGDESIGYSGFAKIVLAQGDHAFVVFDQRMFEIACLEEEFRELWEFGGIKKGETVADLAMAFGLDPATLEAEIAAYDAAAQGRQADAHGRRDFGLAPMKGPFYGCRTVPGLFHTQGGLRIDRDARVMRADGRPIPNLFAGGGAAAGISGKAGARGYASGNGLLTAIALGRLAALAAAAELKADM